MSEPATNDTETPAALVWRAARALLLATTTVWAFRQVTRLALEKRFSVDEFQYAHAAWALAQGQVQYRDFFEVHFPLAYQYMSLVYRFGEDDPARILDMRMLMLPLVALMGWAAWRINARYGRDWALLGPILLFTLLPFTVHATEIRNDPVAFAAFLASIAILHLRWPSPAIRAVIAGVALGLACWGTQKAFVYASFFLPALLADLLVHRKRGRKHADGYLLARPLWFLAGAASVALVVAIDLTLDDNWAPMWHWCFAWAADYQNRYDGFSWQKHFMPMIRDLWWYLLVGAVGVTSSVRNLAAHGGRVAPDHLLLGALFSTFLSFTLQQAPWPYSALPFLGVVTVFAARGLIVAFAWFRELSAQGRGSGLYFAGTLTILLAFTLLRTQENLNQRLRIPDRHDLVALQERYWNDREQDLLGPPDSAPEQGLGEADPDEIDALFGREPKWERFEHEPAWASLVEPHNEYQLRVLRKIGELTNPDDAVYDNTGSYVARPHGYFFYYTEQTIRRDKALMLATEVPEALVDNEVVMVVHDGRYDHLPKSLKKFIRAHYQPYNGDLWLWGKRLRPGKHEFTAIKRGEYLVHPPKAARQGHIRIDGETITSRVVELEQGKHQVQIAEGGGKPYLLWVPRNGERWHPNDDAKSRYTTLF